MLSKTFKCKKLNYNYQSHLDPKEVHVSLSADSKKLEVKSINNFREPVTYFKVKDIQSFIFGGLSSRFWMMRKIFNTSEIYYNGKEMPFYAWQCISL